MGLGVPRWWFTVAIPPLCLAIARPGRTGRLATSARRARRPPSRPTTRRRSEVDARGRQMIATLLVVLFVGLMLVGVPIARRARPRRHGRDRRCQCRRRRGAGCSRCRRTCYASSPSTRCSPCRCSCWSARSSTARASPGAWSPSPRPRRPRPRHAAAVAILVAMVLGGISGSGPANAAAVGGVMIAAMAQGRLSGGVLGQRGRRGRGDRHPDPAVDRLHRLLRATCPARRCRRCSPPA